MVTTYGRRFDLRLTSLASVPARVRGRRLQPVCGDVARARPIAGEQDWLIEGISQRRNELTRPDSRGRIEVLAANISLLIVVAAPEPKPDWYIVDRYLAAARLMGADALIAFNKQDLPTRETDNAELDNYARAGFSVLRVSALEPHSSDALLPAIRSHTAICVGQSGVGKSSLINTLLGHGDLRTANISSKTGEGRHTTVNSRMLFVDDTSPREGAATTTAIIDSPGVRDYAPAIADSAEVANGFAEIVTEAQSCRFANCRHLQEPGCAVKSAVAEDRIAARRYESYRRLLRLTESLQAKRR